MEQAILSREGSLRSKRFRSLPRSRFKGTRITSSPKNDCVGG